RWRVAGLPQFVFFLAGFLRVNADSVDRAVDTDLVGQAQQRLDRILFIEVDDLRSLFAGHFETRWMFVDREHASGAQEFRTRDRELSDRTASENRDRITIVDLGH